MSVVPGYTTKAIVISPGAEYETNPLYDELVKVRVPEIHGLGPIASYPDTTEKYTEDEYLPWARYTPSTLENCGSILEYKAQNIKVGSIVFVQFPTGSEADILVTGVYSPYYDDLYKGIDLSDIVANAKDFTIVSSTRDDNDDGGNPKDPDPDGSSGSGTGAKNSTQYKYIFGNIFSSKDNYYISAGFPKYSSGKPHSGIDLAGKTGTSVYACGDGKVIRSEYNKGGFGNFVMIKHSTKVDDKTFYSICGHFTKRCVSVGATVKGTQLVADTAPTKAFKKKDDGTYEKLTSEPKDWKLGGWKKYYKNTGTSRNPVYKAVGDAQQKGTKIGERGSTGNSTGPHTHFMLTTDKSQISNKQVKNGYIKNPKDYISF